MLTQADMNYKNDSDMLTFIAGPKLDIFGLASSRKTA